MICPVCGGKTRVLNKRETGFSISYRKVECMDCLTRFKTKESYIYESIPYEIRQNYIENGRMKK